MEEEEENKPKGRRRSRLIVRLGEFLISHHAIVSVLCCTSGIIALFLLPILAKNTYISENALMPGSANPAFSGQHTWAASSLVQAIMNQISSDGKLETPSVLAQHMFKLGAEVYHHNFHEETKQFNSFHFFSSIPTSGSVYGNRNFTALGINTVGILRAPRGDGKECIVMVTPYNTQKKEFSEAVSLGLAYSVFTLLSQATWLTKDIVWVAADSQYGELTSIAAWLREYHNPNFFDAEKASSGNLGMCFDRKMVNSCKDKIDKRSTSADFRRAGTMAAGLVLKISDKRRSDEGDSLTIYSEASNGQMPNLDLINVVHYLAAHRQSFRVKVGIVGSLLNSVILKTIGKMVESLSEIVGSLNSKWKFGIPAADYVEGSATLASSMWSQALGVPTGPHGAFRDYQIDAVTLEFAPRIPLQKEIGQSAMIIRAGRLTEGVIRSVNNLLEKFHQSFFLYLLTSPNKFVSVGVYMIPFALLMAPLPIVAAALFSAVCNPNDVKSASNPNAGTTDTEKPRNAVGSYSWQWIHAAKMVFIVHIWAVIVSLMPHFIISHLPNLTTKMSMLVWISLSITTLAFFCKIMGSPFQLSKRSEWVLLKAVMIAATSIGLCLMSIINFATAQTGSFFLVPMCLLVRPLRRGRQVLLTACNLLLGVIGFPPAALLIAQTLSKGLEGVHIEDLWRCTESLWEWNSATYLYLFIIHLPCWVLFMKVLFYP